MNDTRQQAADPDMAQLVADVKESIRREAPNLLWTQNVAPVLPRAETTHLRRNQLGEYDLAQIRRKREAVWAVGWLGCCLATAIVAIGADVGAWTATAVTLAVLALGVVVSVAEPRRHVARHRFSRPAFQARHGWDLNTSTCEILNVCAIRFDEAYAEVLAAHPTAAVASMVESEKARFDQLVLAGFHAYRTRGQIPDGPDRASDPRTVRLEAIRDKALTMTAEMVVLASIEKARLQAVVDVPLGLGAESPLALEIASTPPELLPAVKKNLVRP